MAPKKKGRKPAREKTSHGGGSGLPPPIEPTDPINLSPFASVNVSQNENPNPLPDGGTDQFSDYDESARLMNAVPDVIGDQEPAGDRQGEAAPATGGIPPFEELGDTICEAEDMAELIELACDHLASWRDFEDYRISEDKAARLSRPYSRMVNSMWAQFAPALLRELSGKVPGLASSVFMTAIVFGPIVRKDLKRSRARKSTVHTMPAPAPAPESLRPKGPGGAFVRDLSPDESA